MCYHVWHHRKFLKLGGLYIAGNWNLRWSESYFFKWNCVSFPEPYFMLPQSWFQQLCMLLWKLSIANELNIFLQREKCPNTNIEFFLAHIFLYSDQKKLRSWTFFTQYLFLVFILPIVENDRSAVALLARITSNNLITFIMDGISSKSLRKKCPYSELFWSAFSHIRTEYGEILRIFPYSVRMRENVGKMWTRITSKTDTFYASQLLNFLTISRVSDGFCSLTIVLKTWNSVERVSKLVS